MYGIIWLHQPNRYEEPLISSMRGNGKGIENYLSKNGMDLLFF